GHDSVRVLNGGLRKWVAEGRALGAGEVRPAPAIFTPRIRPELRATAADVVESLHDPGVALIDARDEGQYVGAIRRGPRGGHIPGAIHLPRESLIGPDATFKPAPELRR